MVEFALIFIFIMIPMLAFVADAGTLLDVHNAGIYAARQGARTGAVLGTAGSTSANPNTDADCAIVGAVHSAIANQPNITVNEITIYKAGADGQNTGTDEHYIGTADCQGNTIVDSANCPQGSIPGSSQCPEISTLPGSPWTADQRDTTPYFEDSLGVEIDYTFQVPFNLITGVNTGVNAGPFQTSDYAVYPMNPSIG
jgi:hypothetical protein